MENVIEKKTLTPEMWEQWGTLAGSIVTSKKTGKLVCWINFSNLDNQAPICVSKSIWMDKEGKPLCENTAESIQDCIINFYQHNDIEYTQATHEGVPMYTSEERGHKPIMALQAAQHRAAKKSLTR